VRLLLLGGTKFLGRAAAEEALRRGHDVTLFNRGETNPELFPDAEHLHGDRDGNLDVLHGREWDAVIDPSGYVPRVVRASAELLQDAVGHYVFVSSVSVYRDFSRAHFDETAPRIGSMTRPSRRSWSTTAGSRRSARRCRRVFPGRSRTCARG
jgi:2'-hydroxyisoflavone reductase